MAGTIEGGTRAAATNRKRYGSRFYERIGQIGGSHGVGPDYRKGGDKAMGFAANPDRARRAGAKGGRISRRRPLIST